MVKLREIPLDEHGHPKCPKCGGTEVGLVRFFQAYDTYRFTGEKDKDGLPAFDFSDEDSDDPGTWRFRCYSGEFGSPLCFDEECDVEDAEGGV